MLNLAHEQRQSSFEALSGGSMARIAASSLGCFVVLLAGAVAHGLPTVTTRGESLENAFRNNENVLLCKPKDPDSLAAALDTLMLRPELRQQLSCGALAMARQWFSWDTAVDRTMDVFGFVS